MVYHHKSVLYSPDSSGILFADHGMPYRFQKLLRQKIQGYGGTSVLKKRDHLLQKKILMSIRISISFSNKRLQSAFLYG